MLEDVEDVPSSRSASEDLEYASGPPSGEQVIKVTPATRQSTQSRVSLFPFLVNLLLTYILIASSSRFSQACANSSAQEDDDGGESDWVPSS